jgi:small subunit ribosomal protein S30
MNSYKVNLRLLSRFNSLISQTQRYISSPAVVENEHEELSIQSSIQPETEKVEDNVINYPKIFDKSDVAKDQRKREAWFNKVKRLGTVEEKIFELNMPKYYGWKVNKIQEGVLPYDPLPQAQYITRTHLASTVDLPKYYDNILSTEQLDYLVKKIKSQVEDALIFEYYYRK